MYQITNPNSIRLKLIKQIMNVGLAKSISQWNGASKSQEKNKKHKAF